MKHESDIPEHLCDVYGRAAKHIEDQGYLINDSVGEEVKSDNDFEQLMDIALPETPFTSSIRVFLIDMPLSRISRNTITKARKATSSIPLLAFTNDGNQFLTIASDGIESSGIDFIPPSGYSKKNQSSKVTLRDLQPILSIYVLRQLVTRLSNIVFADHGHDRLKLFDSLMLMLATKVYDELNNPHDLQVPSLLKDHDEELLSGFERISKLARNRFSGNHFWENLTLNVSTIRECLDILSPYSIRLTAELGSQTDIMGTFYQEVVSSTFRGSLGAYFTPKPIADLATAICQPQVDDKILDFTCGSGTFLVSTYLFAKKEGKGPEVYGCDIQDRMVITASLNCLLHGIYKSYFMQGDGLRLDLKEWASRESSIPVEGFSLIVGNPPFAGYERNPHLPFEYGNSKNGSNGKLLVHKIIPFIAKTVELLRPGGRAALVIPTSVLNAEAPSFRALRKWLQSQTEITAVIELPRHAFVHTDTGIEGALLFFRKRSERHEVDNIFFTRIDNIGYDRRGKTVSNSEIGNVIGRWSQKGINPNEWISSDEFYSQDRWDPTWLWGYARAKTKYNNRTHVKLTTLCTILNRRIGKNDIESNQVYRYFEVKDTDMDSGKISDFHEITGENISNKSRLRLRVRAGDILLPNHRDSLVAKTAEGIGRSVVMVPNEADNCLTTNRFTTIKSLIDPKLLIFILNSPSVREQLVLYARGSASFDIRDKVLSRIWVSKRILNDEAFREAVFSTISEREKKRNELEKANSKLHSLMDELN